MQRLFRSIALAVGLTRDPDQGLQSAERPVRILLAASIAVPILLFLGAGWVSYRQHYSDAVDRVQRNLGIVHEHARKVFETFELTDRYLDQILGDATNEQIRAQEGNYSNRLRVLVDALPQLADLWIVDERGQPLVSGTVFPMPALDLSDRSYFTVHRDRAISGAYVSEILEARAAVNTRFFSISRRRTVGGQFAGVIIVSVSPHYFTDFYKTLPPPSIASLLRSDGVILARHPDIQGAVRQLPADAPILQNIRTNPTSGTVIARSSVDGVERIFSYRSLAPLPIYVSAGTNRHEILRTWMRAMASHLVFGVPAMLAMIGLGLIALARTRRLDDEIRRREATEVALRQSQKMEAVGRLSGGIAHDFNNMLTVILGNIDMALQRLGPDQPRLQRALEAARQGSQRAATLVQRLLAFSRQQPLEVKAVDVNRLVQSMSELVRRTIGETVVIETVLAGGLWPIAVDPNQLENALVNLAVNARDAMPDGGKVTIETANAFLDESYAAASGGEPVRGQYVVVAVTDTGTGMSQEVMERAFEPFFTTKPPGMGTGLGLSMVYGFAKQSNGHIKIHSRPGDGTSIRLYFPRLMDAADMPSWPADERIQPAMTPTAANTETILLVEDEDAVNQFGCEVLRDQGYRVVSAANGPSALRLLEREPAIDLLFTDVVLPAGMNGRQLADEVQRLRPGIRVLFATGYTRDEIVHDGKLDPDVELLNKPFTSQALVRKVRDILDGRPAAPR